MIMRHKRLTWKEREILTKTTSTKTGLRNKYDITIPFKRYEILRDSIIIIISDFSLKFRSLLIQLFF